MKTTTLKLEGGIRGFAEDKDQARELRVKQILPALESDRKVVLDFKEVKFSTQSFVHALIGEALQRFKETALERMEFRNCSPQLKSIVQLVVDYSLGGFQSIERPPVKTMSGKAERKQKSLSLNSPIEAPGPEEST